MYFVFCVLIVRPITYDAFINFLTVSSNASTDPPTIIVSIVWASIWVILLYTVPLVSTQNPWLPSPMLH